MDRPVDADGDLVRKAKGGDFDAFDALVRRHQQRVFSLASRIVGQRQDAEEAVQQTFLSVVEKIADFREESAFATWLTRIATNHALALLRKRAVRRTVPLADDRRDEDYSEVPHPEYIAQWRDTPERIAARRETRQLLNEALDRLDEKYRLVFLLRDVEGLSIEETSQALDISVSNVKVRLLRARLMLRERLTHLFGDESTRVEPDHKHE
ncbi:MAG: sigma-70 family RNA polymerase sigma factor [Pirellulales bacterium]|nr:sigma-70 family RNA polymerase sigma factor [Pirellulales bacterium]